jgi:hypothetical protein
VPVAAHLLFAVLVKEVAAPLLQHYNSEFFVAIHN